jgi:general stress protein 26
MDSQEKNDLQKLKELVEDIRICMFTTVDDHSKISSRPMSTVKIDESGYIWFFTNEYSETIQELSKDNMVSLIYAHPSKNIYIDIKGTTSVIINKDKIKELWNPMLKAWFPKGFDDPKLCLIKVAPQEAYYWKNSSNQAVVFLNILKAIATREQYAEGEHGKIKISQAM